MRMKIFITGATGYIGTVVTEKLRAAGHSVRALARSDEAARKLAGLGAEAVRGNLRDTGAITDAAAEADATIHLAMEPSADAPKLDRGVIDAVLLGVGESGKRFLYTSGVWVMGNTGGRAADESTPVNPTPMVAWRPEHENLVLHAKGSQGIVIRPAMVYGRGGGFAGGFARAARQEGVVRYVGSGDNRWPFVHVDDVADFYVLALQARGGSLYFLSAGPSVAVKEVAQAAARGAKVESIPLEEARNSMGIMADALVLDQLVSSRKATRELGWTPRGKPVLDELAGG
jgi:nucleoside-diphosphate-sugar epimerase